MTWLRGLLLGLAIAAAPGPMGVLCVNRSLRRGMAAGLVTGLGTTLADGLYALLGSLGVAGLTGLLVQLRLPLQVAGGLLLFVLGWRSLRAPQGTVPSEVPPGDSLSRDFLSSFALTLANPMTILSMGALFATLSSPLEGIRASLGFAGGIAAGSLLWWTLLSGSVHLSRRLLSDRLVGLLQRGTAWGLLGLGGWILLSALR